MDKKPMTRDEAILVAKELVKLDYNEKPICPRCGSELIYEAIGTSGKVHCSNKECIVKSTYRGI